MKRRDFLKRTAVALSLTTLVTRTEAAAQAAVPASGMRIRESFISNDRLGVAALAQAIVGGRFRFLDSTQAKFYARFADLRDSPAYDSAWLLWADDGVQPWLLNIGMSTSPVLPTAKNRT